MNQIKETFGFNPSNLNFFAAKKVLLKSHPSKEIWIIFLVTSCDTPQKRVEKN
jgi:hypothetical protein